VASCLIQEVSFSLNNNVRGLNSIGELGYCDIGVGEVGLEGTLNMYFQDETYFDNYLAGTAFSLVWRVTDSATPTNTYVFTLPQCKFITDAVNSGGKNSDVMENTGFMAYRHPTLGFTMMISRYSAT